MFVCLEHMYFCKHKLNFDIAVNAGPAEHNSEYIDVDNIEDADDEDERGETEGLQSDLDN